MSSGAVWRDIAQQLVSETDPTRILELSEKLTQLLAADSAAKTKTKPSSADKLTQVKVLGN